MEADPSLSTKPYHSQFDRLRKPCRKRVKSNQSVQVWLEKLLEKRHAGSRLSRLPFREMIKTMQVRRADQALSPRTDSVFVGPSFSLPKRCSARAAKTKTTWNTVFLGQSSIPCFLAPLSCLARTAGFFVHQLRGSREGAICQDLQEAPWRFGRLPV